MPSKRLKKSPKSPTRATAWKDEPGCSESALAGLARALARELKPGDRVILEGPMGAGKSTFGRALLEALGVKQSPEGSPTFAIAHQYDIDGARQVAHLDLYRIKNEGEIEDAGIPDYFWNSSQIVLCEWLSLFPNFEESVLRTGRNWRVLLAFDENDPLLRRVQVLKPLSS